MNPAFFPLSTGSFGPEKAELCAAFLSGEQWHSELGLADYTAFHIVPARSVQPVRAYAILQPFQTADLVAAIEVEGSEADPSTGCKPCLWSVVLTASPVRNRRSF